MKTEISDFCREYSRVLIPAGAALDVVVDQVQEDSKEDVLRLNLAGFNEVKHRLKSLIDKVEGQQAYLLIFGPLKSGKSTLMNAVSGAYVSEVTSLPAYPCLVYVRHGLRPSIKLIRYNGRETATEDKNVMEVLIKDSHSNLADRIRRVEEKGREFDPGLDYPEAIRRIDIDIEAEELNDSGTVLVDTPGLYSRMKFGYDLMTREFRDSAACAVFVVKTDNLFLEQVFQEFNDLLGLFSRVFLVVNIDSSKRDLRPDGSLKPSLESKEPQKIIDAFQLLSMSAALRKAAKEGRLKIYPIDLLNAASRHLQASGIVQSESAAKDEAQNQKPPPPPAPAEAAEGAAGGAGKSESAKDSGEPDSEPAGEPPKAGDPRYDRPEDFRAFLDDLTEYLNSSDYLFELMNDSFRQGDALREEMLRHCSNDSLTLFESQQQRLRADALEVVAQSDAAQELNEFDWSKAFGDIAERIRKEITGYGEIIRRDMEKSLLSGIDNWFENTESLDELINHIWRRAMEDLRRRIGEKVKDSVQSAVNTSSGGALPIPELVIALDRVRLSLREVYKKSVSAFEGSPKVPECLIHFNCEELPIARTFWDRILFRSQSKIRRRLLGAPEPANEIAVGKKLRRFHTEGREMMTACVRSHLDKLFPGMMIQCAKDYLQVYIDRFQQDFIGLLKSRSDELEENRQQLESRIQANDRIASAMEDLKGSIAELEQAMFDLREKYLRSARLARGFQVIESSSGAFSLWTLPYCGRVEMAPRSWLVRPVAKASGAEVAKEKLVATDGPKPVVTPLASSEAVAAPVVAPVVEAPPLEIKKPEPGREEESSGGVPGEPVKKTLEPLAAGLPDADVPRGPESSESDSKPSKPSEGPKVENPNPPSSEPLKAIVKESGY